MPLLEVRSLVTELTLGETRAAVVDDVSISLESGKTLAVVGESGCGKSMLALSLMRILPEPLARVASGSICFNGLDLAGATRRQMRAVQGKDIGIVFQDPSASLNPVETVGTQIIEVIREHEGIGYASARARALELLRLVRLPDPEARLDEYPHRLSGGMCQRVMIAMAIACNPKLIIADEPTTALDVTIQAQILALLKRVQAETGAAIILITHNLAIVPDFADEVAVMYAGRIVEFGAASRIFAHPRHPYTVGLLEAIPHADAEPPGEIGRLREIPGSVPLPGRKPAGCAFEPRCRRAAKACTASRPELSVVARDGHRVACVLPEPAHA